MREKSLHERIMAYINIQPGCKCRKRHGTAYGHKGDPDLYGSLCGLHFEFEIKQKGEKPTPLQQKRLKEWEATGSIVGWFDDFELAKGYIDETLARSTFQVVRAELVKLGLIDAASR